MGTLNDDVDDMTRDISCMHIVSESESDNESDDDGEPGYTYTENDTAPYKNYIDASFPGGVYNNINETTSYMYDNTQLTDFDKVDKYEEEFSHKQLRIICEYYKIRNVLRKKCNKLTLSSAIVQYECDPKHVRIVKRRKLLWTYIIELADDAYMKSFMTWK
jgi:hypothetical protein